MFNYDYDQFGFFWFKLLEFISIYNFNRSRCDPRKISLKVTSHLENAVEMRIFEGLWNDSSYLVGKKKSYEREKLKIFVSFVFVRKKFLKTEFDFLIFVEKSIFIFFFSFGPEEFWKRRDCN